MDSIEEMIISFIVIALAAGTNKAKPSGNNAAPAGSGKRH
jgi:hypothetical protein